MMNTIEEFIKVGQSIGVFKSGVGFIRYCNNQLFPYVDFTSKKVLEIGAGDGIYSIWSAIHGASNVVALEPSAEGSSYTAVLGFKELLAKLSLGNKIRIVENTFQEYFKTCDQKFDIIILVNSINHLNEEMCIKLKHDAMSREYYVRLFKQMNELLNPYGKIIITDCSNTSFWTALGITNPFASSIEWFKHQPPKVWINLLTNASFENPKVTWTYHPRLPHGLFDNKLFAYFYNSLFRLEMTKGQ